MAMRNMVLLMLVLAVLAASCGSEGESESVTAGVPDKLTWITPEELTETLSTGPATVVNFWASWCGPCRAEAPVLRRAHEEYGSQVRFIGVAVDDTAADAFDFMESFGITFDNYLGNGGAMRELYGAFGIPFTVFTDGVGEVLNVHRGIIDDQLLELWTDELSRLG
jgi:thiol-disulfide isomerase/thioredoxin